MLFRSEQCDKTDKNSSHIMPNITVSEIGGESVQPNTERLVYTQRKTRQKSQSQHVPFGNDQSRPLGTEAPEIIGSPTPNLPSILVISSLDLDIPIALTSIRSNQPARSRESRDSIF